jgi:hypothetical protein
VPFLNPVLYANPKVLKDITTGNNDTGNGSGRYRAAAGWDACTGLGSPDGNALLKTLRIKLGPIPQNQDTMIKNRSITRSADGTGITGTTGLTGTTGTTGTTGMTDNTGNTGEASYFHNQLPRAIAPNAIGQDYGHSLQGENFNAHSHAGDANNEVAAKAAPAGSGINNGAATGFVYGMCCHCDPGIVAMVAMVSNVAATAITAITGIAAGNGRK